MAILETGIGGRLDATNAIQSDVSVITSIDFDHEKWLGNTLAKIAGEKAGIIKPEFPLSLLRSNRMPKKSFVREPLNAKRRWNF